MAFEGTRKLEISIIHKNEGPPDNDKVQCSEEDPSSNYVGLASR